MRSRPVGLLRAVRFPRACCCRSSATTASRFATSQDLPRSARSVTDLRNRRIYLRQEALGMHTPRAVLLQTLGHFVLGHSRACRLRRVPASAG